MSTSPEQQRQDNAHAWDLRTAVHLDSPYYAVEAFKAGESSLRPPELELIGDVTGLRLLHLQCHFGLDTLSWARLGAQVTGLDISPASIEAAKRLAAELNIEAEFVCEDVQAAALPEEPFDLVFCSYGVTCWLESLPAWAARIAGSLRPGGRFVLVEFHPVLEVLHPGKVSGTGRYFGGEDSPPRLSTGTYTDPEATISYWERRWQHPIGEVAAALLDAGLAIEGVREYPYCSYRLCDELDTFEDGVWRPSDVDGLLPYMYAIVARSLA